MDSVMVPVGAGRPDTVAMVTVILSDCDTEMVGLFGVNVKAGAACTMTVPLAAALVKFVSP